MGCYIKFSYPTAKILGLFLVSIPTASYAGFDLGSAINAFNIANSASSKPAKCKPGNLPSEKQTQSVTEASNLLIDRYFALSPNSTHADIDQVFSKSDRDNRWKNGDEIVPIYEIGSRLKSVKPELTKIAFQVGGYGNSARGVWKAKFDADPSHDRMYAVEFFGQSKNLHIFRMSILTEDKMPTALSPYCHVGSESLWLK